jgi:hypothetical protein
MVKLAPPPIRTAALLTRSSVATRLDGMLTHVDSPTARRLGRALVAAGAALVPWMAGLAVLGVRWRTAWVGLDTLEALGLVTTGLLLRRGDRRCSLAAAVTATLLVVDAWFDTTTASPGLDRLTAVAAAGFLELPLAAVCAVLAARTFARGLAA